MNSVKPAKTKLLEIRQWNQKNDKKMLIIVIEDKKPFNITIALIK